MTPAARRRGPGGRRRPRSAGRGSAGRRVSGSAGPPGRSRCPGGARCPWAAARTWTPPVRAGPRLAAWHGLDASFSSGTESRRGMPTTPSTSGSRTTPCTLTRTGLPPGGGGRCAAAELFGDERVSAYVSPYRRTHQTFRALGLDPAPGPGHARSPGCASRTGGTGRTRGRPAAEGLPGRLRPLLLPLRPGRVRSGRLRPGRGVPGEPVPQLRATRTTRPTSCWSRTGSPCGCSACAGSTGRWRSSSRCPTRATPRSRTLLLGDGRPLHPRPPLRALVHTRSRTA